MIGVKRTCFCRFADFAQHCDVMEERRVVGRAECQLLASIRAVQEIAFVSSQFSARCTRR